MRCEWGKRRTSSISPRGVFELGSVDIESGARVRGHPPVASVIRAFDTVLSSMKPRQVLCLVLHVCYLSVFVCMCCMRHISVVTPSKPVGRGSLIKNGLRIVNKNIVVNFACVVIPGVPQEIWLIRMKFPL